MHPGVAHLAAMKQLGEMIAVLTAYDYPAARLLDDAGVDALLVGDSLGMVVLGYPDTTSVTMEEMLHHTRAVARAASRAPVVADLPNGSYETAADAVRNAERLLDAGAHAVKLEGGVARRSQIEALHAAGIPLMGHIGMLPQNIRAEGRYKIKGRTAAEAALLLDDARVLEAFGACAIVLELVEPEAAHAISSQIVIPTIGIGSGAGCDGQVLVSHDLFGAFPWFTPKFVRQRAQIADEMRRAAAEFVREVKGKRMGLKSN